MSQAPTPPSNPTTLPERKVSTPHAGPAPNPGAATVPPTEPPMNAGLDAGQVTTRPTTLSSFPYSSQGGKKMASLRKAEVLSLLYKHASTLGLFKEAKDMPHFTEQDRPEKVKDIYKALKREHPDMPAEMKARIAARQGKPGHQHQGPPYKGPLTKESAAAALVRLLASDNSMTRLIKRANVGLALRIKRAASKVLLNH